MEIENYSHNRTEQNSLPYEPLRFVYTETIGSINGKLQEIIDPYTWSHSDILEPRLLHSPSNAYYYYLFHTAPIYNWLRHLEYKPLADYINSKDTQIPKSINTNKITSKFDKQAFQSSLNHYITQWQVVKLCICAKVRILTTKISQNSLKNSDISQKHKNNKSQHSNLKQTINNSNIKCVHLIKKEKMTSNYSLPHFNLQLHSSKGLALQCNQVYCDECEKNISVRSQIIKLPFAPIFGKFHGKQIIINQNTKPYKYYLTMIFGQQAIFIRSAGGIWYQTNAQKVSLVSFDKIDIKKSKIFVYHQEVSHKGILKKVEPLAIKQSKVIKNPMLDSDEEQILQENNLQIHKNLKNYLKNGNQNIKKSIISQEMQGQESQQLKDMSKNPLPIVLNKKRTDRKLFKEYKKTVESFLPKPKQKDEYEKNYDKGKTKKIHKNKQIFRTADFFNLYKEKTQQKSKIPSKKINKAENTSSQQEKNKSNSRTQNQKVPKQADDDMKIVMSNRQKKRLRFQKPKFHKNTAGNKKFNFQKKTHFNCKKH